MTYKMKAMVGWHQIEWQMSNLYDVTKTAFVWMEDDLPIQSLTAKLIPSSTRGGPSPSREPHKLFLMKPKEMSLLPEWCSTKKVFELQRDDTHHWLEIVRRDTMEHPLRSTDRPLVLFEDGNDWILVAEENDRFGNVAWEWSHNLCSYGLGRDAASVTSLARHQSLSLS